MAVSPVSLVVDDPSSNDPANGGATSAVSSATTPREPHLRTQFLRRVAHDIASPTGVAMTVLDELAHGAEVRPELLGMARRSLRRLMRLSEQLSLVAELESGLLTPDASDVDFRNVAKHAFDEALSIDGRRDVVGACALPDVPLPASVDSRVLGGVLREIIGNALRVASSRVELTVEVDETGIVMRVDDDGPGFSAEARATLGRRFVPRAASRGLGLSLSIASDVLRSHGGSLEVEQSRLPPGRRGSPGASVVVRLPAGRRERDAR